MTCGHELAAAIHSRVTGNGCPGCSCRVPTPMNNLAATFPQIACEWHPSLNGDLRPDRVVPRTTHTAFWRCQVCGHDWQTVIRYRTAAQDVRVVHRAAFHCVTFSGRDRVRGSWLSAAAMTNTSETDSLLAPNRFIPFVAQESRREIDTSTSHRVQYSSRTLRARHFKLNPRQGSAKRTAGPGHAHRSCPPLRHCRHHRHVRSRLRVRILGIATPDTTVS